MRLPGLPRPAGPGLAAIVLLTAATGCAPAAPTSPVAAPSAPPAAALPGCERPGWEAAARANAESLRTRPGAPFGRQEIGWEIYAPLFQREIGVACPPESEGFAAALAAWQAERKLPTDGVVDDADFLVLKGVTQERRPIVMLGVAGVCPETADEIAAARPEEGYGGKPVWLRPGALHAYRRMVAAARAEAPEIAADPRNLTIFSGYRSPSADAARCQAEGNCDGIVRATCSPHRTGLALDLYVGQAPGYRPDSSADPNRLHMTRTATYRWLLANAGRFGFVNYPFEPWHWEWTGEPP